MNITILGAGAYALGLALRFNKNNNKIIIWSAVKEEIDANGFIGIFSGGFKASAVGISAALVLGYLASLIFRPKLKKW